MQTSMGIWGSALFYLFSSIAVGGQLVIVAGENNYPRYENVSKLAYETAKAKGNSTRILAGDGTWKFAEPGVVSAAETEEQIEKAIKEAASKLKPGENFTLFINDHGEAPTDPTNPLSASVVLKSAPPRTSPIQGGFLATPNRAEIFLNAVKRTEKIREKNTSTLESEYRTLKERHLEELSAELRKVLSESAAKSNAEFLKEFESQLRKAATKPVNKSELEALNSLKDSLISDDSSAPTLSLEKLTAMLKKHVPATSPIQLVGVQCFSGGIHSIPLELPNACAAASTTYKEVNKSDYNFSKYGQGFWNEVKDPKYDLNKDNKTSLFEAHLAGFEMDPFNGNLAQLSSIAFVDSVLKEGAFDPKYVGDLNEYSSSIAGGMSGSGYYGGMGYGMGYPQNSGGFYEPSKTYNYTRKTHYEYGAGFGESSNLEGGLTPAERKELEEVKKKYGYMQEASALEKATLIQIGEGLFPKSQEKNSKSTKSASMKSTSSRREKHESSHDGKMVDLKRSEVEEKDGPSVSLEEMEARVKALEEKLAKLQTTDSPLRIPQEFLDATKFKIEFWRKNKSNYQVHEEKASAEYSKLKEEWQKMSFKEQMKQGREFTQKFDRMEEKAKADISPILKRYGKLMDDFDKVERFSKVATPEQMATLSRLLECESKPL